MTGIYCLSVCPALPRTALYRQVKTFSLLVNGDGGREGRGILERLSEGLSSAELQELQMLLVDAEALMEEEGHLATASSALGSDEIMGAPSVGGGDWGRAEAEASTSSSYISAISRTKGSSSRPKIGVGTRQAVAPEVQRMYDMQRVVSQMPPDLNRCEIGR